MRGRAFVAMAVAVAVAVVLASAAGAGAVPAAAEHRDAAVVLQRLLEVAAALGRHRAVQEGRELRRQLVGDPRAAPEAARCG